MLSFTPPVLLRPAVLLSSPASRSAFTPHLHLRQTPKRPHTPSRNPPTCLSPQDITATAVRTSEAFLSSLNPKRLASYFLLLILLYLLRPFYAVIVATFILGYVANSLVSFLSNLSQSKIPRRALVGIFYTVIVTAISTFSLMTIPTLVRESNYFISTLQSANPYVYVANSLRNILGDDLTTKLETYVSYSIEMPQAAAQGRLPASATDDPASSATSQPAIPPQTQEWSAERARRLGMLLQKSLRNYIAATVALITKLLGASTKVIFKALLSLLFSFMIMWDLPALAAGIARLRESRVSWLYEELAPVVSKFGSVLGKSFEAQGLIALVNTTLTTAGLLVLSIPGVGFLCIVTLLCSFIPVAGVFVSTLPMIIIALSEYGVAKAMAVVLMVILVHIVEAYVLNPQIYSAHLHLHPFVVLVVLYVAEHSFGIPGLLLAVPVAVYIIRTIMKDDADRVEQARSQSQLSTQSAPALSQSE